MKKIISVSLLVIIYMSTVFAYDSGKKKFSFKRECFYFGIVGGYGFSAVKNTYYNYTETSVQSGGPYQWTVKPFSFGKGINTGLYLGYMFGKHLGAEVESDYLIGNKFKSTSTETVIDSVNGNSTSSNSQIFKGNMLRLIPSLKIELGENKIHYYLKTGLIIGVLTKYSKETDNNVSYSLQPWGNTTSVTTWQYKGGICLGFHGAVGISFRFTDRIGVFAEFVANYQNYAPKKAVLKKDIANGVDQLPALPTSGKEIEYYTSYTSPSGPIDTSKPQEQPKFYIPFSSVGFNIGLHIFLDKKETK